MFLNPNGKCEFVSISHGEYEAVPIKRIDHAVLWEIKKFGVLYGFVLSSCSVDSSSRKVETCIFQSNIRGEITNYKELNGFANGHQDHDLAIRLHLLCIGSN